MKIESETIITCVNEALERQLASVQNIVTTEEVVDVRDKRERY